MTYCWQRAALPPSVGRLNHAVQLSPAYQRRGCGGHLGSDNTSDADVLTKRELCLQRMWCSCELQWPEPESCGRQAECCGHSKAALPAFLEQGFNHTSELARTAKEYFSLIRQCTFSGSWMGTRLSFVEKVNLQWCMSWLLGVFLFLHGKSYGGS